MELIGKLVAYLADGQTRNLKCMKNLKRERERLTVFRAFDLTSKFKLINNYFQLQITQLTFIELDNLKAFSMVFFSSFSLSLRFSPRDAQQSNRSHKVSSFYAAKLACTFLRWSNQFANCDNICSSNKPTYWCELTHNRYAHSKESSVEEDKTTIAILLENRTKVQKTLL